MYVRFTLMNTNNNISTDVFTSFILSGKYVKFNVAITIMVTINNFKFLVNIKKVILSVFEIPVK